MSEVNEKRNECSSLVLLIQDENGKIRALDTEFGEWRVVRVSMDDECDLELSAIFNSLDVDFVLQETSETFSLPVLKATPVTQNDDDEDDDSSEEVQS